MKRSVFLAMLALTAFPCAVAASAQSPAPVATTQTGTAVALVPYVGGRTAQRTVDGVTRYTYAWPGVYFEAAFTGPSVAVKVDDDQNALYLYVDGIHKLTLTRPGKTTVALKDLGEGKHVVRLEKTSETQGSTGAFEGFYVDSAAAVLPPPSYVRAIEFVGDSITVGYGITSRGQTCTVDDVRETTNTSESWAQMVAKHYSAAYRINANSGKGIVRNYAHLVPDDILPNLYGFALFDRSAPADDSGWNPDAIVVNLGTNDFSTALKEDEPWKSRDELHTDFEKHYVQFVKALHKAHPKAHIVLLASADANSPFTVGGQNEQYMSVAKAAEQLKAAGVKDLEFVPITEKLDYMACHGHPSLKDAGLISKLVIAHLDALAKFAPAQ